MSSAMVANPTNASLSIQENTAASQFLGKLLGKGESIADICLPKSTSARRKDGTYIKPAGRPFANSDWDEMRGVWVRRAGGVDLVRDRRPSDSQSVAAREKRLDTQSSSKTTTTTTTALKQPGETAQGPNGIRATSAGADHGGSSAPVGSVEANSKPPQDVGATAGPLLPSGQSPRMRHKRMARKSLHMTGLTAGQQPALTPRKESEKSNESVARKPAVEKGASLSSPGHRPAVVSGAVVAEKESGPGNVIHPKRAPRKKAGRFVQPAGRPPKGYDWDPAKGVWIRDNSKYHIIRPNKPPGQLEDGTFTPPRGRHPAGYEWDKSGGWWFQQRKPEQQNPLTTASSSSSSSKQNGRKREEASGDPKDTGAALENKTQEKDMATSNKRPRTSGDQVAPTTTAALAPTAARVPPPPTAPVARGRRGSTSIRILACGKCVQCRTQHDCMQCLNCRLRAQEEQHDDDDSGRAALLVCCRRICVSPTEENDNGDGNDDQEDRV